MNINAFFSCMKYREGVFLTDRFILFRKKWELYDTETGESVYLKTINKETLAHKFHDVTLSSLIEAANNDIFMTVLSGRGSSGADNGRMTFKFSHAPRGNGGDNGRPDLPARMNTKVSLGDKSPDAVLKAFRQLHVPDNKESAVTVDEYGYVTQYVHGGSTSVAISGRKGEILFHNHPGEKGGNFSDSDLISTAMDRSKGIVASGREGDYVFLKGTHFNASGFVKAVRSARMKGKNYDDAADKWLKANQKKYGYKYAFKKA